MHRDMPIYTIQQWLFTEASGRFEIDLAESGIQFHHVRDLEINTDWDLNYSQDRGDAELREKIASCYKVEAKNVIVTHGAQEALFLVYGSIMKPGDHLITFTPGWQQAWDAPRYFGVDVSAIPLRAENGYRINSEEIRGHIQHNTRFIVITNPMNPTGTQLNSEEMTSLIKIAKDHNIKIIADEEYILDYNSSVASCVANSIAVSGLSKVHGLPGLRTGWAVGSPQDIERMVNLKRFTTVCNSILCERLALQALQDKDRYISRYKSLCHSGLKILKEWIVDFPEVSLIEPEGTPFAYLCLRSKVSSTDLCRLLLEKEKVLLMPAEVFEDKQAIRISFGRPSEVLHEGLHRIGKVLREVRQYGT